MSLSIGLPLGRARLGLKTTSSTKVTGTVATTDIEFACDFALRPSAARNKMVYRNSTKLLSINSPFHQVIEGPRHLNDLGDINTTIFFVDMRLRVAYCERSFCTFLDNEPQGLQP
jgi:hypothetical protein